MTQAPVTPPPPAEADPTPGEPGTPAAPGTAAEPGRTPAEPGHTPAEPRWLTDDQQRVWRQLVAVLIKLPAAMESQLQREAGITHMGYFVLSALSETPGRTLRMGELAARANSSLSRLSHVVRRLEAAGWVQRRRDPTDGRAQLAVLTDAGMAAIVAAAPGHVERVRSLVFDVLDPEQVEQLGAICTRLLGPLGVDPAVPEQA